MRCVLGSLLALYLVKSDTKEHTKILNKFKGEEIFIKAKTPVVSSTTLAVIKGFIVVTT
jgi:hypothetical protein